MYFYLIICNTTNAILEENYKKNSCFYSDLFTGQMKEKSLKWIAWSKVLRHYNSYVTLDETIKVFILHRLINSLYWTPWIKVKIWFQFQCDIEFGINYFHVIGNRWFNFAYSIATERSVSAKYDTLVCNNVKHRLNQ